MIQRVLETEVMDTPDEAKDYDAMDHSAVNRAFVEDFLKGWTATGTVLDVGTGTAQIPILLCQRTRDVQVVAVDYARHMLALAASNVHKAGLRSRLQLQRCDAKQMPFADGTFGAVISNSIVHHIPQPAAVIREMTRVVALGGRLFVRDLLRPTSENEVGRLVALYAGDANEHQRAMFADSLRAALTLDEIRALVTAAGLPAESVTQTSDRHWTWAADWSAGVAR